MKLSIIVPAYNAEPYIDQLMQKLEPQITADVEVLIIDDGSATPYKGPEWAKVTRQENGGASAARNTGLDQAHGEYIAFIDADDLVSDDYVTQIFKKIDEGCDYVYLSWQSMGIWNQRIILKSIEDKFPPYNLCVWNRIYKRSLIGKVRFNTKKKIAEDAEFIRKVNERGKKGIISEPVYFYRSDTPDSLTKRFAKGIVESKRIVYYFQKVTKDMTYLIDEFKKIDKDGEVILLTYENDLPELEQYAMVMKPCPVKATEKRGEPTPMIELIQKPIKTQVVMWTKDTYDIGGIETFIYSFCRQMCKHYDIIVLYDRMDSMQIQRLMPYVECRKNDENVLIECDTLIVNRIIDPMPANVKAKQTIQMVHGVKHSSYHVPQDKDIIVSVSEAVKESFGEETKDSVVIRNMLHKEKSEYPILIVSTTRTDTQDKGIDRMIQLAKLMNEQKVSYIWLCFTNRDLPAGAPKQMVRMEPTLDIIPWVQKADYLAQLSDHEAFCYSIVEALTVKTPLIVTPLTVLEELGAEDGKNCYVVPFDIGDYDTTRFKEIPKFEYTFSNNESVKRWKKVLGNTKPTGSYKPAEMIRVLALQDYHDNALGRLVRAGESLLMTKDRAELVTGAGYGRYE